MPKIKPDSKLGDLLGRFPKGYAVSPSGLVYEVVFSSKKYPLSEHDVPDNTGYLVVVVPELKYGDDRFLYVDDQEPKTLNEIVDGIDRLLAEDTDSAESEALELYNKYRDRIDDAKSS